MNQEQGKSALEHADFFHGSDDWKASQVAPHRTHHLNSADGRALYRQRYDEVMPFHPPGLAPAYLGDAAFHILPNGKIAYPQKFNRTFGFYDNLATVIAADDWFHIHPNGRAAYQKTWRWCGNFQQQRCPVRNAAGQYQHIHTDGSSLAGGPYRYAGDFKEDAAVVRAADGWCYHINRHAQIIHSGKFFDLDVFHKGRARARDADGWFHITRHGNDASHGRRYRYLEPFYNGQALAKTHSGENIVIDEHGQTQIIIGCADAELHDGDCD